MLLFPSNPLCLVYVTLDIHVAEIWNRNSALWLSSLHWKYCSQETQWLVVSFACAWNSDTMAGSLLRKLAESEGRTLLKGTQRTPVLTRVYSGPEFERFLILYSKVITFSSYPLCSSSGVFHWPDPKASVKLWLRSSPQHWQVSFLNVSSVLQCNLSFLISLFLGMQNVKQTDQWA